MSSLAALRRHVASLAIRPIGRVHQGLRRTRVLSTAVDRRQEEFITQEEVVMDYPPQGSGRPGSARPGRGQAPRAGEPRPPSARPRPHQENAAPGGQAVDAANAPRYVNEAVAQALGAVGRPRSAAPAPPRDQAPPGQGGSYPDQGRYQGGGGQGRQEGRGGGSARGGKRPLDNSSQHPQDQARQSPRQPPAPQPRQPAPEIQPQQPRPQPQAAAPSAAPKVALANTTAGRHQSNVRFQDLPVSDLTKKAMSEIFGYEYCTHVQALALPACLTGRDVLAKAKTGTGKTIGFMIPVIETLINSRQRTGQVGALILSPTRELASQIHQEATKLLTYHKLSIQVVIGGTNMSSDVKRMRQRVPDILVATPGRVLDHLTNDESILPKCVEDLRVLVCDEADNILDMGFRPTIEKILARLPPRGRRQALLFSATFPRDVQDLAKFALQAPYQMVDTVGEETQTNVQVSQYQQVVPFEDQFYYVYAVIMQHMKENPVDYKVIVFFPTARQTQVFAEAFSAAGMDVLEIHSRKSQAHRTRVSDQFRAASRAIMFSSDVSARGVDYPDVSLVLQVGVPTDKAQYVHRVGRTARAGKAGEAVLVLCDFEEGFLKQLSDLPIVEAPQLAYESRQVAVEAVSRGLTRVSADTKSKAYQAWLGFYNSCPTVKLPTSLLVETANRFAALMGCPEPPELEAKTVGKMGLKGVPGLRIAGRGAGGGGGGGRGGGGGHFEGAARGPPGGGRGGGGRGGRGGRY